MRKVAIDSEKCDGCGLCVSACHEGALEIVDGKAVLARVDACDGMGDCLPACPRDAIRFDDALPMAGFAASLPAGVQWPMQIGLVGPGLQFFKGKRRLVVAADCAGFAAGSSRERFVRGDPVVIGCPKLDDRSRFDVLSSILKENVFEEVDVVRMEVPCCGALMRITGSAVESSGRDIAVKEVVVARDGRILKG